MAEWLSVVGLGEDGLPGLAEASLVALSRAEVVFGSPRLLAQLTHADKRPWPVPFSIAPLLALRGRKVAALVSGDPFWHGAGGAIADQLPQGEWRAWPAPSVLSLAAAALGWRLEEVTALGLHAAPFARLRPALSPGARLIVTLRDGQAPAALAAWLTSLGFGDTLLHVMERLGGAEQQIRLFRAADPLPVTADLVSCALEVGEGPVLSHAAGRPDEIFEHDGQITRRPIRALALSALAPRGGELLWDLGAGSGSVGIEWLLAEGRNRVIAVEQDPLRAARARRNAAALGCVHYRLIEGKSAALIGQMEPPAAVFIGGGLDQALLERLTAILAPGTRLVAHGVTLETEALLIAARLRFGGDLLRIGLSEVTTLGQRHAWKAAYPVTQWRVQL